MHCLFVRIGSLGEVYAARGSVSLPRGCRVLVRSARGVELGEVIGPRHRRDHDHTCEILRPTTAEDELLIQRLEQHKREAVEQCREELSDSGSEAVLLDIDHLFDGGTLLLHFLGAVDEAAESITQRVAQRYESVVRTGHFAQLLEDGCGPNCGTDESSGCGSGCAGCAARIVCHSN